MGGGGEGMKLAWEELRHRCHHREDEEGGRGQKEGDELHRGAWMGRRAVMWMTGSASGGAGRGGTA